MKGLIRNIPNILTLLNLLSGVIAIFLGDSSIALILFVCALLFDVLDGWAARKLGVQNELGVQLDSLADLVSFGVMPSFFLYLLYRETHGELALIASIIPVASAYRLGKFNLLEASKYFKGLPTPSSAIFIMSIVLIGLWDTKLFDAFLNHFGILLIIVLFCSGSMLSNLQLISLKGTKRERRLLLYIIIPLLVLGGFFPIILLFIIPAYFLSGWLT